MQIGLVARIRQEAQKQDKEPDRKAYDLLLVFLNTLCSPQNHWYDAIPSKECSPGSLRPSKKICAMKNQILTGHVTGQRVFVVLFDKLRGWFNNSLN